MPKLPSQFDQHMFKSAQIVRDLEPLALLLALNQKCAAAEQEGRTVSGPGLPGFCAGDGRFLSDDCLRM